MQMLTTTCNNIAKFIGITEREISVIRSDGIVNDLNPQANCIRRIADELTNNVTLQDETFTELFSRYLSQQAITDALKAYEEITQGKRKLLFFSEQSLVT